MRLRPSSDWFNPMLVRDVRQGLRSRLFTAFFLLLQGGMVFVVVLQLASRTGVNQAAGTELGMMLYLGIAIFYYGVMPLLACFAFGAEYREGRLDLLKLTQLSARQLVLGKWTSLVVQLVLVTVSLLPYLVLRYFIGGVDLTTEMGALTLMLVGSIELVGFCLAIACLPQLALRILATTGLMALIYYYASQSVFAPLSRGGLPTLFASTGLDYALAAILLAGAGLPVLWLAIEFAAARLAPLSENHDTPQRWALPLLFAVAGIGLWMQNEFTFVILFVAGALVVWVLMHAAASEPSLYPSSYRPFVRFGLPGRAAGRLFLYPGWPSSVPLILATCAVMGAIFYLSADPRDLAERTTALSLWALLPGAILFPQVAGWLFRHSRFSGPARYLVVLLLCLVLVLLVGTLGAGVSTSEWPYITLCLFPPCAWFALGWDWLGSQGNSNFQDLAWTAAVIGNVPTLLAAVLGSRQYWPFFSTLERLAAAPVREPPAAHPPAPAAAPPPAFAPAAPAAPG